MSEQLPGSNARHVPSVSGSAGVFAPQPEEFDSGDVDFRKIWLTLKRRRWTVALTAAFVVVVVAVWTILATPLWRASTLIRVDEDESNLMSSVPAIGALVGVPGTGSQIETELRMLRTRPVAERVVADLNLNFRVTDPRDLPRDHLFASIDMGRNSIDDEYEIRPVKTGGYQLVSVDDDTPQLRIEFTAGEPVELPAGRFVLADLSEVADRTGQSVPTGIEIKTVRFQRAVEDLMDEMVALRPERDANVLEVSYETTDRSLVHSVPNALAESFIERRIQAQKADALSTVTFLEAQVEETRQQLEAVESELADFREGEQMVAVEAEAEALVERLATLQTRRTQLDAERSALSQLLSEIDANEEDPDYRRLASFPTFFQNQAITGMLGSLVQADSARSALLARKTSSHPDVVTVEGRIQELEAQLGSIGRNYLGSLSNQISAIDTVLAQFGEELEEVPARQIRFARIQRQVDMLGELYTVLRTRLKEAQVQAAIDDSSVRIMERAIEPLEPVRPRPAWNLALAATAGLILGIVLAFVREYMDRRLHGSESIEALYGIPTMGRIPGLDVHDERDGGKPALVALDERHSADAESFRNLRTNIGFARRDRTVSEIVITSPSTGEGKSLTAANLAITMAQKGRRTLLLDADMRRPVQHEQFDAPLSPGLSECLLADELLADVINPTMLDTLFVLPAGHPPPNPAELLDSPQMDRLLETLRTRYDAVILDSPPVLAVTDSAVLAPKTDGVILVVRAEKTDKDAIALAIQQMRQVDAEILGVVVNDAKAEGTYQSYYKEYYGEDRPTGVKGLIARVTGAFS